MPEDYNEKLPELLTTLFQLEDSADLDFGIYRIMNKKRAEIEHFINEELFDIVDAEFGNFAVSDQTNLTNDAGLMQTDPKNSTISDQHKNAIFSHIYLFLSRYYDHGDYITKRRYSQTEKYAIPYNGEEVILYWANNDQYYIKTGEHFKNYAFKKGEYTVNFCILDAESTMNNNKSDKRYFVLKPSEQNPKYDPRSKTLTIFFEYRGLSKDEEKKYGTRNVQDNIDEKTVEAVLSSMQNPGLKAALNGGTDDKAALGRHLRKYTKRNTSDYFIHKNLKGFLTRELDFYIKNEVFHLDDLGTGDEVSIERYVTRAKVIKTVCLKIIDFLAQIEDFQKELFEKKKFVMRTDYCMTLDNVPEKLYPEILRNDEQLSEWKTLYGTNGSTGEAHLKKHPYLVLDTKFFDLEFKDELLASFNDLDDAVGGLMIQSENWQALNLMREKYREKVKCIYIDPPYNTGNDEFMYKDNYQHSSWLSMMEDRLYLSRDLLQEEGVILVSSDDRESNRLKELMDEIYGRGNFISTLIWNTEGHTDNQFHVKVNHEYTLLYSRNYRNVSIGYVIDPNTRKESNLWKGFAENSITKNGPGNPPSEVNLPAGFPVKNSSLDINPTNVSKSFFEDVARQGYITRDITRRYSISYPIQKDKMIARDNVLTENCRVFSGWANVRKLQEFIDNGFKPLEETDGKASFYISGNGVIYYKKERESARNIRSVLRKMGTTEQMRSEIENMGLISSYPKPKELIKYLIKVGGVETNASHIVFDFFAGSGTTAHSILDLNKQNVEKHRYILVEMADFFDTVMKPRIQKVMYSDKWKDGKPQSNDGISHIFKYLVLEQYEDTLNNIEFNGGRDVQSTLLGLDGYFLRYMLDFETRDSTCRLNVEKMSKPFNYMLKITEGNEMKEETADLVETFNYLLGIHVGQIRAFNNNGTYYRVVFGKKDEDDIAIIWRNTEKIDLKEDKAFIEGTILNGSGPSKTYINADFVVEGACPIEPEFKKLMGA